MGGEDHFFRQFSFKLWTIGCVSVVGGVPAFNVADLYQSIAAEGRVCHAAPICLSQHKASVTRRCLLLALLNVCPTHLQHHQHCY